MSQKFTFHAIIEAGNGGGAFVRIPLDVEQTFGKKRVPINASIDGQPYRGSLVRMGEPCHILGILKEIRSLTGKDIGDTVEIILEEDTQPRQVEVPPDLVQALAQDPHARAAFENLSYSHQKEYVRAILEARREQTRRQRISATIEMIKRKN